MGSVLIPDFGRWNTLGRHQGYSSQRVESTALSKKPLEASSHSVKKQDRRNILHVVVSVTEDPKSVIEVDLPKV